MAPDDASYRRYACLNLPHARTVAARIGRTLRALGAFGESGNGGDSPLHDALVSVQVALDPFDEDPSIDAAVQAADLIAVQARELVEMIVVSRTLSDRLGQHVRNLFECLGLGEEGAALSLRCGERPDSPLR